LKVRKAVIPAAGLGTRMLPATKTIPKEMLPIVDKPSIQYIIEEAVASGIEDILVVTNRAKSAMDDYFDYHPELEQRLARSGKHDEVEIVRRTADIANIFYVRQKETKGLGHAIWRAKRFVGDEPFAVLLGDDIMLSEKPVTGQLIEVAQAYDCSVVGVQRVAYEEIGKYCTLGVKKVEERCYDVEKLIEKPRPDQVISDFAILGRYVLTPRIFDILENLPVGYGGEIQLTDGLHVLCEIERVMAYDFIGKRYDTGNLRGYLEVVVDFALEHPEVSEWMRDFIKNKAEDL
jgi:UTP--glucose-1-phosphate uridylyltransferase